MAKKVGEVPEDDAISMGTALLLDATAIFAEVPPLSLPRVHRGGLEGMRWCGAITSLTNRHG